jgi:hypothetical protein
MWPVFMWALERHLAFGSGPVADGAPGLLEEEFCVPGFSCIKNPHTAGSHMQKFVLG